LALLPLGEVKVVIADGAAHTRSALRLLLEQHPSVRRVTQAATYPCVAGCVERAHADILLLDWRLPGLDLPALRSACPGVRIIVLCTRPEERSAAMAAGADAFVCKGDAPEALLAALGPSEA
jgi:DNA-binding NarL/FixJ family response regulator